MAFTSYRGFGVPNPSTDDDPISRLKQQIGFSEEPVQDAQGYWTIGYGRRLNDAPGGPKPEATISEPIADEELRYFVNQGGDARPRIAPTEQQVADVYVSNFPNEAAWNGHVGIGVNNPQTQGFYPANSNPAMKVGEVLGNTYPGTVKADDLSDKNEILRIPTTPDQDRAVQNYIDQRAADPGSYNLYDRNCRGFVSDALQAGGISLPETPQLGPFDKPIGAIPSLLYDANEQTPNHFFNNLKRKYGPSGSR